jgi:hypothetical protein
MKTAMQELFEYLDDIIGPSIKQKFLEKEKEQICNAYTDGLEGPYIGAEQYYNQTYKPETI